MNNPTIKETITVFAAVFIGLAIGYKMHAPATIEIPVDRPVDKIIEQLPANTIVHLSLEDIKADLLTYPHLSTKHCDLILNAIHKASTQYNINPLVIYATLYVESTFRWWLVHEVPKTKDKEPAIGIGGVRYSVHGEQLKLAGIIDVKADLYDIEPGILAMAYIYDNYRKQPLLPGATSADMSAMLRYFGGNHKEYFTRIDDKISALIKAKIYR